MKYNRPEKRGDIVGVGFELTLERGGYIFFFRIIRIRKT